MRMALLGRHERIDAAERAFALGMVSQVVDPPEALRDEAQALAEKIAQNSPAAMAATKRALWGALEAGLTDACKAGANELISMWGHPDQEEGPRAFAEKREPRVAAARARPAIALHASDSNVTKPGTRRCSDLPDPRHAAARAARPRGLADQQPPRPPQRDERPHARRVRDGVARARRGPRGPRHRAHRRGAGIPDRRRRHGDRRGRHRLRALPRVDGEVRLPLHRLAEPRLEAGHHRGQRHLRGRRLPLGGRRRHRDRGLRRAVLRPARVGRPGGGHGGHRAHPQDPLRGGHAHGPGRAPRAAVGRARRWRSA